MTNLEKIKAMGIKKMTRFLTEHTSCASCPLKNKCTSKGYSDLTCFGKIEKWLESEAE